MLSLVKTQIGFTVGGSLNVFNLYTSSLCLIWLFFIQVGKGLHCTSETKLANANTQFTINKMLQSDELVLAPAIA